MATMIAIYKITSPTNKVYIGQTWDTKNRFKSYNSANCHKQKALHRSFLKHGVANHKIEVVNEFPHDITQDVLDEYEIFHIAQHKEAGFLLLNLTEGGSKGRHVLEVRQKMGLRHIGNNHRTGKKGKLSEETKKSMSASKIGKKFTSEHRTNILLNNPNRKPVSVFIIATGQLIEYQSMRDAARGLGMAQSNVSRYLTGKRKSKKYSFSFVTN